MRISFAKTSHTNLLQENSTCIVTLLNNKFLFIHVFNIYYLTHVHLLCVNMHVVCKHLHALRLLVHKDKFIGN